jgi:hypothetical protein
MTLPAGNWILALGGLALVSLVPIVWAIVDVLRRPTWQFPTSRKVLWVITLAVGWLLLWPMALVSAVLYLMVFRKRFPVVAAKPSMATWDPYAPTGGGQPPSLPPAGWYPDPSGQPGERWWDGRGWSEHVRPAP